MRMYFQVVILTLAFVINVYHPTSGGTQTKMSNTQTKLDSLKSLIYSNAKTTVTLDSTALKELVKLSTSGSSKPTNGVSFSVSVGAKSLVIGKDQTIIYDQILTNDGNGYDDRTGVFVCPVAGTYMIVVDTLSDTESSFAIKVNKKIVAKIYSSKGPWNQTSRTVIVKLKHGEHVKVDNVGDGNLKICHDRYSGFTGTLLY